MKKSLATKTLLLLLTLGVLAYFGMQGFQYFSDPLTTTLAYSYQVDKGIDLTGYVIRRERVLTDEGGGLLRLQRSEGEKVSSGGTVAVVYANQASLDRQRELDEVNARLEQLRFAQEAALGSEVSLKLDAQIMESLLDFRAEVAADRLDKAEEHEVELKSLVLKRDYTYSDADDLTGQIQQLETRLGELKAQAASSVRRVAAPQTGIYSAVVDGYESVLMPDMLEELMPSDLSELKGEGSGSELGKLILGDDWYYAVTMKAEEAEELEQLSQQLAAQGSGLCLRFAKGVEQDLQVKVEHIGQEESGRVVVVLHGRTHLPQLTLLRQQSAAIIRETITGIRVPQAALHAANTKLDETGQRVTVEGTGLYCVVGMEARFKPVRVLYSGDGFVLVESTVAANQENLRLRPGDEIIIAASGLYDGKVIK